MQLGLRASPEIVLTLQAPSLRGSERGRPPRPAPAGEEGRVTVVQGQRDWGAEPKGSQEVVGHGLLGGDAPRLLGSSLKDDKIFLEMLIQLQDGCHIPTAAGREGKGSS